jgi:hypothetical protein
MRSRTTSFRVRRKVDERYIGRLSEIEECPIFRSIRSFLADDEKSKRAKHDALLGLFPNALSGDRLAR